MTSVGSLRSPFEGALVVRLLERPPSSARLPVGVLTRAEKAAELPRLQARKAMDAAYEAELVPGLAPDTPDTLDPPADQPGARRGSWAPEPELPGVSQFFPAELSVSFPPSCPWCSTAAAAPRRTWRNGPGPTANSYRPPGPRWPPARWTRPAPRSWPTCWA
jgi:hypothetical protein